jgi:diguanylate cyclase (GGDEF)-like protein
MSSAEVRKAFMVVLSGDRMGETFTLNEGRTSIGRGLHADIRVNDEGISREHAIVELDEGKYMLSDAGSTNGTFSNGDRVDRHELAEGDKVQIGATSVLRFTFEDDADDDLQRSLYESALRDRLTGIFNRGYFNNRLESDVAFALRHGKPLALVMFDIDNFRAINDSHGQEVGDAILHQLAQRVQRTTRSEDIFARYGGEEFGLICRDVDALRASKAANRISSLVREEEFQIESVSVPVSVSLGVADLAMLLQPSAKALVEAADTALFVAKRQGRDRVEIFDPESEPTRLV